MENISIIKGKNLYMNGIVNVLREEMTEYVFSLYNYQELINYKKKFLTYPDLLIIEISSEIDVLSFLNNFQGTKIKKAVLATSKLSKERLIDFIKLDIDGYFYFKMELDELKSGIRMIFDNEKYIHPVFSSVILQEYLDIINKNHIRPKGLLTLREWEILEEMVNGYNNDEIAERLNISDKTVKNHVSSILNKLHVKDRTNAVVTAIRNNWVSI